MHKLIGLFALVAVVAGNDLIVGSDDVGKKIYDQKLEASPAIWRQDKNYTVNATEGYVISRVVITDLREGKDGEATVVEGGQGHKTVTIELKSPAVFRGFEFNVQVYVVSDTTQQGVSTDYPKSDEATKVPEFEPKVPENDPIVPISVTADDLDDNLRKTRKTEEQGKDNVTPQLFVNNEASTTPSATSVHESTPVSNSPTPISSKPTTSSSNPTTFSSNPTTFSSNPTPASYKPTPVVIKDNNGEKFNIPIGIGKDINTEVSTTQKSNVPVEKNSESDIIDPTLVGYQPSHLNNTEKSSTENTKATDKTTEKPAIHLPEINEGLAKDPKRNVRHTEDGTTERDITTVPSTTGYESTTELKETTSSEDAVDSGEIHILPNYNWGIKSPIADTINPIGNNKDLTPPKTFGADNVAVQNKPAVLVPLPYNH